MKKPQRGEMKTQQHIAPLGLLGYNWALTQGVALGYHIVGLWPGIALRVRSGTHVLNEWMKHMPQSLAGLLVHIVFSTKLRERIIADDIRDELHAYTGGLIDNLKGTLLHAGSVQDHVHLLAAHPRTCSPAELIEAIKTGTSKWIKTKGKQYKDFHWQGGYGIFSISPSHRPDLETYLDNQAEHHRHESFQDEFRRLLQKYKIEFDERYVWD